MSGHKQFSKLVAKMSPMSRARVDKRAATLRAEMPLHELRAAFDLSQKHLADLLEVDQPVISRMERRTDMMLSTLARFVEAMGGQLEVRAAFPDGVVRITGLAEIATSTKLDRRKRRNGPSKPN